ncbi:nuclease-related domain-containing protein [Niallia sp. Krafla_26]|uniref:nuclease-related domain-containing protein n=1 Tax=Niallia sp. Krafla_26 TaxID=3064703 RepID=UPI003D1850F5
MENERKPPLRLLQEEALARRLPKNHPTLSKIQNSIAKRRAGYRGELNTDYHLTFLPHNRYTIVRDLSLTNQYSFQIDTLLLSPQIIFILETKNIYGELFFDKYSNQLIRTIEGHEDGFTNPREQAERQSYQFQNWLKRFRFPTIPIEYFATISYPQSIMKTNDEKLFERVFHTEHIVKKILQMEQKYSTPVTDNKTIRKLYKKLLMENNPEKMDVLSKWGISPDEMIRGVQCPECEQFPMKRIHGVWFCTYCMNQSKKAHIQAVQDYFLLFNSPLTNKTCREFLLLSSRRTTVQILNSMNLIKNGTTKTISYSENR